MQYRKKPVVIEAVQFLPEEPAPEWYTSALNGGGMHILRGAGGECSLIIDTLEGRMTANLGDWIIMGVKGELYPCKPDIFAATYEPA